MNKNDLKNGMFFEMRNKSRFLILNNEIYLEGINLYEYSSNLHYFLVSYNDDMCSMNDNEYDIMEVFNSCNESIWKRGKVDWAKVPVDTKVLVRNSKDEEWQRKHFAEYKNGKVFTYDYGTSWNTSLITTWEYAKLVEEPKKEMIVSAKDLHKAFRTMCESHPRCDCCDYNYSVGTCEFKWILDNYNVTRKE
ncbi:MAG: hypothetical protein ACLR4X_10870 [Clostridia bacterium]